MKKFRNRVTGHEVQAIQVTPDSAGIIEAWCGGILTHSVDALDDTKKFVEINVPTLDGNMRASEGDWVIRFKDNLFRPCSARDFEIIYKEV